MGGGVESPKSHPVGAIVRRGFQKGGGGVGAGSFVS